MNTLTTKPGFAERLFTYGQQFARSGGRRMGGWEKLCRTTATQIIAVLALSTTAGADIDFTPRHTFSELEGIKSPNITFTANHKPVTWCPPSDWQVSGGAAALTVIPNDSPMASGVFRSVRLRAELPVIEANMPLFVKMAQAALPPLAEGPEILGTITDPLRINGLHTCAVSIRFLLNQQRFVSTILFVSKGLEQIQIEFTARERDFKALHESFRESLYSIQGL